MTASLSTPTTSRSSASPTSSSSTRGAIASLSAASTTTSSGVSTPPTSATSDLSTGNTTHASFTSLRQRLLPLHLPSPPPSLATKALIPPPPPPFPPCFDYIAFVANAKHGVGICAVVVKIEDTPPSAPASPTAVGRLARRPRRHCRVYHVRKHLIHFEKLILLGDGRSFTLWMRY